MRGNLWNTGLLSHILVIAKEKFNGIEIPRIVFPENYSSNFAVADYGIGGRTINGRIPQ